MRLNLGCGRAQLPTTPGHPMTKHLESYLPTTAYTHDWLNVDSKNVPGVDEVINVFEYPWRRWDGSQFAENSVDEIWASHLVEHIPHDATLKPRTDMPPDLRHHAAIDGWFAWMYQAWHVLKPDGLLHLVIPWPMGKSGVADPTHRRYVHPGVFSYTATPNPDAPFDYQIRCHFEMVGNITYAVTQGDTRQGDKGGDEWIKEAERLLDAIHEYYIPLRAVKDATDN